MSTPIDVKALLSDPEALEAAIANNRAFRATLVSARRLAQRVDSIRPSSLVFDANERFQAFEENAAEYKKLMAIRRLANQADALGSGSDGNSSEAAEVSENSAPAGE